MDKMSLHNEIVFSHQGPTLDEPVWQMCTSAQFDSEVFSTWARLLFFTPGYKHRKFWEWAYIMQAFERYLGDTENKLGLGFGVGKEPLVAAKTSASSASWRAESEIDKRRSARRIEAIFE